MLCTACTKYLDRGSRCVRLGPTWTPGIQTQQSKKNSLGQKTGGNKGEMNNKILNQKWLYMYVFYL